MHIFSGASNYASPILQTGTPLHETDVTFDFFVTPFDRSCWPDLFVIKKSSSSTRTTEIHVLSGRHRFQHFVEQSGSALHETDATFAFAPVNWDKSNPVTEVGAIKKQHTDTHSTEVHILRQSGKGYALEMAKATLLFANDKLSIKKLAAITTHDNQSSISLLVKLGFQFVTTTRLHPEEDMLLLFETGIG